MKPVATKNDLDILIAVLFLDAFALMLHGIQYVLNLALVPRAPQGSRMPSLSPRHPLQRPQPPRKIRLIWPSTPLVCWPPLSRSCSPILTTSLAPRKRNGRSPQRSGQRRIRASKNEWRPSSRTRRISSPVRGPSSKEWPDQAFFAVVLVATLITLVVALNYKLSAKKEKREVAAEERTKDDLGLKERAEALT